MIAIIFLFALASAQLRIDYNQTKQQCPSIKCVLYDAYMEPNNLCIYHEKLGGTDASILLRSCEDNPNQVCNLFSNFAWT